MPRGNHRRCRTAVVCRGYAEPSVQKLAPDGSFLLSWGGSGSGKGEFLGPSDIALDRDGRVLVVDTQNHRVQVFADDGQYLWEIGKAGRGP